MATYTCSPALPCLALPCLGPLATRGAVGARYAGFPHQLSPGDDLVGVVS